MGLGLLIGDGQMHGKRTPELAQILGDRPRFGTPDLSSPLWVSHFPQSLPRIELKRVEEGLRGFGGSTAERRNPCSPCSVKTTPVSRPSYFPVRLHR